MKMKFLLMALVLCLTVCVLCACGESEPASTEAPTSPAGESADPTTDEASAEPTDKGIFVTESPNIDITLPSSFGEIVLPEDEFGDDVTGVFESHPITEPEETDPGETEKPTEAPVPTAFDPDILPEHVFDEE